MFRLSENRICVRFVVGIIVVVYSVLSLLAFCLFVVKDGCFRRPLSTMIFSGLIKGNNSTYTGWHCVPTK